MIVDSINNAEKYFNIHSEFPAVFEKLREMAAEAKSIYDRQMSGQFSHIDYTPGLFLRSGKQLYEYHEKFIDIHYIVEGFEYIDYCKSDCICTKSKEMDRDFFLADGEADATIKLTPGMFAIFFCNEPHKTQMGNGEAGTVSKFIAKVST